MSDVRSRFQGLERPRTAAGQGESPLVNKGRFADAPSGVTPPEASTAPEPQFGVRFSEPPLALDDSASKGATAGSEAAHFLRCAYCQRDNGRFDVVCATCKVPLDTPEQRAFNEQLWAARREQEQATAAELSRAREVAQSEEAAPQRAMGVAIAHEVAQREHQQLAGADPQASLGVRLLRCMPDSRTQVAAAFTLVLLGSHALWSLVLESRSPSAWIDRLVLLGLAALFIPPRYRWRSWLHR
jgi:hypothetical protein